MSYSKLAVAGALSVSLLSTSLMGCVAAAGTGPSLARYDNTADPCNAQRQPLIQTENQLGQRMVAGALIGGVAGAGVGAAASRGDLGSILVGAAIGAALGATAGYYDGVASRNATREQMMAEINGDASVDAGRFSAARGVITNLNQCRNQQLDTIQADFSAGRISREEALRRVDGVKTAVNQDNDLIHQVLGHMNRRTETYVSAATQATGQSEDALLGAAKSYNPGTIIWNDSSSSGVVPVAASSASSTTASGGPGSAYVATRSANVRSGPGTNAAVVGGLGVGDSVQVTGRTGDWYKVLFNNQGGYIHNTLLAQAGSAEARTAQASRTTTTRPAATASSAQRVAQPAPPPRLENEVQRVHVEAVTAQAAAQQNQAQLNSRADAIAQELLGDMDGTRQIIH